MKLDVLNHYLNRTLQPERFSDYCPNGLQVEGRQEIQKIVTGVTASMDLLQAAKKAKADALLVHHGYFWRGEPMTITGIKKRRIHYLLQHDINLFAYHLPLDAHAEFGNNVMLGKVLGLEIAGWLDDKNMLAWAELNQPQPLQTLVNNIALTLKRGPQVIGELSKPIKTIAWCTGAAQGYIEQAIAAEMDVYISGEISEQTVHSARESNTSYIAAGHHVTERYGIQALGEHLAKKFDLQHEFIDIDNPV
ncbi:MAG: Nif3-like dinuclear metal center hexameric protein [Methylophilaceae bacterium]